MDRDLGRVNYDAEPSSFVVGSRLRKKRNSRRTRVPGPPLLPAPRWSPMADRHQEMLTHWERRREPVGEDFYILEGTEHCSVRWSPVIPGIPLVVLKRIWVAEEERGVQLCDIDGCRRPLAVIGMGHALFNGSCYRVCPGACPIGYSEYMTPPAMYSWLRGMLPPELRPRAASMRLSFQRSHRGPDEPGGADPAHLAFARGQWVGKPPKGYGRYLVSIDGTQAAVRLVNLDEETGLAMRQEGDDAFWWWTSPIPAGWEWPGVTDADPRERC